MIKSLPKIIEVAPYDPLWPQLFQEEAAIIQEALHDTSLELHHIGSSSVPDLAGKPIIDSIATVKNPEKFEDYPKILQGLSRT